MKVLRHTIIETIFFSSSDEVASSDEPDEECIDESDARQRIARQTAIFHDSATKSKEEDLFSLVLLGQNGNGKSMLINLLISCSCLLEDQYGYKELCNKPGKSKASSRTKESLIRFLGGNLEGMKCLDIDSNEVSGLEEVLVDTSLSSTFITRCLCSTSPCQIQDI